MGCEPNSGPIRDGIIKSILAPEACTSSFSMSARSASLNEYTAEILKFDLMQHT